MKYKRLTERLNNGGVKYSSGEYEHTIYPQNEHCYNTEQKMILRLASLEDKLESGELQLVKKGKWRKEKQTIVYEGSIDWQYIYICPNCGRTEYKEEPFCHCGTDMRGD